MNKFYLSFILLIICKYSISQELASPYVYSVSDSDKILKISWEIPTSVPNYLDSITGFKINEIYRTNILIADTIPKTILSIQIDSLADTIVHFIIVESYVKRNGSFTNNNYNRKPWLSAPSNIVIKGFFNQCKYKLNLSWNRFYGWSDTINNFILYYGLSPDSLLPVENNYSDTNAIFPDSFNSSTNKIQLQYNTTYYFQIKVGSSDGKYYCYSNIIHIKVPKELPKITSLGTEVAQGCGSKTISIKYAIDTGSPLNKYKLLSSPDYAGKYITIDSSSIRKDTFQESYSDSVKFYKLLLLSNCNVPIDSSDIQSNILLSYNQTGNTINLSWKDYDNQDIDHYMVHRIIGSNDETTNRNSLTSYNDQLPDSSNINIEYYVEAIYKIANKTSTSNTICYTTGSICNIIPKFFTPNGDGKNDIFMPSITPDKLHLIIYNRMGTKIFETSSPDGGWEGNYAGTQAPQSVYIYYIKFTSNGKTCEQNGTVTLIRP